ncbi:MAG: response regulator [Leptolyngbyaceae cyanobacterium CSU_1_3]|nr:response regulator [Leptolyngbyaceae cyanobacterium CSU_1_3]
MKAKKILQVQNCDRSRIPSGITADARKLRQVLLNLVGNAIKFTETGSVTLRVQWQESTGKDPALYFEIEDTGVGIDLADLDTIFEAFGQTRVGKTASEGTGLGLTISRKFIEAMGGRLLVRSTLGQGTCFTVELPIRQAIAPLSPCPPNNLQVIGLAPGQPLYRILVVDDQPDNRSLLIHQLQPLNLPIQEATNGQEAIALWQQQHSHIVIMDLWMPGTDGLQATQQIRQLQTFEKSTPKIIMLSASILDRDRVRAFEAGCDAFLSKPLRAPDLFAAIAQCLGVRYLYADKQRQHPQKASEPKNQIHKKAFEIGAIDPILAAHLYQAANCCDDQQILQLLDQMPTALEEAHTLRKLAGQFQFGQILELLETRSIQS